MSKKRAIVSYEKLTTEQKKQLLKSFPDGYGSSITLIKTPAGETLEALIWETEEIIYLVKVNKTITKALDDDDDDDDDDDLEDDILKPDDLEEDDDNDEDDQDVSKEEDVENEDEDED